MINILMSVLRGVGPQMLIGLGLLIPFILLEQLLPAGSRPRVRDYVLNILISVSTVFLSLPASILAGAGGAWVRQALGLSQFGFSLNGVAAIPYVGGILQVLAILTASMVLHELWFYWSHRLEHKVPFLWEFHKLHHSEERMNSSTSSRDHFLQIAWRSVFSAFTLGLVLKLEIQQAGAVGLVTGLFMGVWSIFYHSGVRLHLPWLNRVLVTPQTHRIHHSTDPDHYNRNFADYLPIFDIVFGTYYPPKRDEFPATGLGPGHQAPRNVFSAQTRPVIDAFKTILPRRRTFRERQGVGLPPR